MTLMDESVWHGTIYSGGWVTADPEHSGDALVMEPATTQGTSGTANLEAFTDTRWMTVRGDIAPYPF